MCEATRLDEPFGDHGGPEGQDRGAVDADRGRRGGHGEERIAWRTDRELVPGEVAASRPGNPVTAA